MVDMKLLRVIIISSSFFLISNCAQGFSVTSPTQKSINNIPNPLSLNENQINDPGRYLWSNSQYLDFFLSNDEKKLHQSAIYHSLNNASNNEITEWHFKPNNSFGMIRVIYSFEVSNGYCRIYQALIEVDNLTKHWTNKACKRGTASNWVFLK
jgi:hypothetical protein